MMSNKKYFRALGLMSGTSLDGLDIADVTFLLSENNEWSFTLNNQGIYDFDDDLLSRLKNAFLLTSTDLIHLSADLGVFYANKINHFIEKNKINRSEIDFIASHGQTIFHQPQLGYTLQIGNGPEIAVNTGIPNINDFRTKDVALGGNGAPLIPVADFLLFKQRADGFLNLGGFSNFSFQKNNQVLSYDICPVNIVANLLMNNIGEKYDNNGNLGASGKINQDLLNSLNTLEYYQLPYPKSLGWEWVENNVIPLLSIEKELNNQLRTIYEHIGIQIGEAISKANVNSVLATGGGAKNQFVISRIEAHTDAQIIIPENEVIDFKEAIGFAFLGVLRWTNNINVWSSVTGSRRDSCSGNIIFPN